MIRVILLMLLCIPPGRSAFPQNISVTGIIRDEMTLQPIRDVNIKVNGTRKGVFSGPDGRFTLILDKVPASITLSCIGYETVYYDIGKAPLRPLEMILRPRDYTLKEVDISGNKYQYIFRDNAYSVLDYEIMDDHLLLLIFRFNLKQSELILLTLSGDTLTTVPVPELKPRCLFRDFLGNVHYISAKGTAYQCYYNDGQNQFSFFSKTTYDSLYMVLQPFLFKTNDRLYFQEFTPDGFGTRIGYYDSESHKKYFKSPLGETTRKNCSDDLKFYSRWNSQLGGTGQVGISSPDENILPLSGSNLSKQPLVDENDLRANQLFSYRRINAPVVKLGESNMAMFNFSDDVIELMDSEGSVYREVPITFHKNPLDDNLLAALLCAFIPMKDWEWCGKILVDEYYRTAYTTFRKNGMVQIRKIDMETGNLTMTYDLPFPFPQKIQVYKGDAYFLNKTIGQFENWKLVKVKL
jgi:hypothetical protein